MDINQLLTEHPAIAKIVIALWVADHALAMAPRTITRASNSLQLILDLTLKLRKKYVKTKAKARKVHKAKH